MATPLAKRLEILGRATDLTHERVPAELTAQAHELAQRAGDRLRLGPSTVVALAGATGSGKSSLTNALAGQDVAEVGVRRPTTSKTLAVGFGATDQALLDWLGVGRRVEVAPPGGAAKGLVVLDLPDHDSTEVAHREEVDRVLAISDAFCFVVDPQKYADAVLHNRYLRPLAAHRDIVTVVLNQADRLGPKALEACLDDLRRLLADDGLADVPVLATSATTGLGVAELRDRLCRIAARKQAAAKRLQADIDVVASQLDDATAGRPVGLAADAVQELGRGLSTAAGVPMVLDAIEGAMRHRGRLAVGWPLTKWLERVRPDPLRRLRITGGRRRAELEPAGVERSSLPEAGPVAQAQLATAIRHMENTVTAQAPLGWRPALGRAVHLNEEGLADALDAEISSLDLGVRNPFWWQLVRVLQWLLIGAVAVGVLWLTVNAVLSYFGLPPLPTVPVVLPGGAGIPLPTVLVAGGVVAGLVLAGLGRLFVSLGARSARRRAERILRRSVTALADRRIVTPVAAELERLEEARGLIRSLTA